MDGSNLEELKRFGAMMNFLGACYSELVTKEKSEAFFLALEPYPIGDIEAACKRMAREVSAPKIPPVSEIVSRIVGTLDQRAEAAFQICLKNTCFDHSVSFEDSAIAVAIIVTAGTWEQWCDWCRWMEEKDFQWKKKQWLENYKSNALAAVAPPKYFVGYIEQQQQSLFGSVQKPALRHVLLDGSVSVQPLLAEAKVAQIAGETAPPEEPVSDEERAQLLHQALESLAGKSSRKGLV